MNKYRLSTATPISFVTLKSSFKCPNLAIVKMGFDLTVLLRGALGGFRTVAGFPSLHVSPPAPGADSGGPRLTEVAPTQTEAPCCTVTSKRKPPLVGCGRRRAVLSPGRCVRHLRIGTEAAGSWSCSRRWSLQLLVQQGGPEQPRTPG